jgi:hypothetical protein
MIHVGVDLHKCMSQSSPLPVGLTQHCLRTHPARLESFFAQLPTPGRQRHRCDGVLVIPWRRMEPSGSRWSMRAVKAEQ